MACSDDDPTQIVVLVDTDLSVPAEMDRFSLKVTHRGKAYANHAYPLTPGSAGAASLPGTFTVLAGKDLSSQVTVEVVGKKGSVQVVSRTARTHFIEGAALLLRMTLQRACKGKSCPKGKTCKAGACVSEEVDPATLPRYSPAKLDKGVKDGLKPPDKSRRDGKPDLSKCGNGKVDAPGEQCDGTKLDGKTCKTLGKTGGVLGCTSACKLDTAGCYLLPDGKGFVVTEAMSNQLRPALASDGKKAIVMWEERRNSEYLDTYAQLVDTGGKLQLSGDLKVLQTKGQQNGLSVVYDGANFFGIWSHWQKVTSRDLRGALVSPAGKLVKSPIDLIITPERQQSSDLGTNGTTHYMVWEDNRANATDYAIHGARVTKAPKSKDGLGVVLCPATRTPDLPRVAVGGGKALVVYAVKDSGKTHTDVAATMVDMASGKVVGSQGFNVSVGGGNQSTPDVAFDGARFLVVWVDDRNGTATDLYATFITTSGKVQSPGGVVVTKTGATDVAPRIAYGPNTGRYLLVFGRTPPGGTVDMGISGVLLSKSGVLTPGGFSITNYSGPQGHPDVVRLGAGFFVVWDDKTALPTGYDIWGARVLF